MIDIARHFRGAATKVLAAVEVDARSSNQHEFNGVGGLRDLLGTPAGRDTLPAVFIRLTDDPEDAIAQVSPVTWYDARANHPVRSELRLYYRANGPMEMSHPGDVVIFAPRRDTDELLVILTPAGSTVMGQLLWLFGLGPATSDLMVRPLAPGRSEASEIAFAPLIEALGIEQELPRDHTRLDEMQRRWGSAFPSTLEFSAWARSVSGIDDPRDDPDSALVLWMETEERLFRTFERHLVEQELGKPAMRDVDHFISFSLSVQNRRKSRAGRALENHVEELLSTLGVSFSRNARTEGESRPDFLFPGEAAYHDPRFPSERLRMLGVKSTCKDRWRQVLAEAKRIPRKHLLTLEPGISVGQTEEMRAAELTLVLPRALHETYEAPQRQLLLDLRDFIELLRFSAA